jgi:hypothetical protein
MSLDFDYVNSGNCQIYWNFGSYIYIYMDFCDLSRKMRAGKSWMLVVLRRPPDILLRADG